MGGPEGPDDEEAKDVAEVSGPECPQFRAQPGCDILLRYHRRLDVQDDQGDRDGEDGVAEEDDPIQLPPALFGLWLTGRHRRLPVCRRREGALLPVPDRSSSEVVPIVVLIA